jgi:hypothetical protein
VALTDRVFMMMALMGTSTERNATASMTAVTPRINTTRSGKRARRSSWKSSAAAEYPPTVMVIPLVPRSSECARCRARFTTSVAVVSEVVSARMTSSSVRRRSVLR